MTKSAEPYNYNRAYRQIGRQKAGQKMKTAEREVRAAQVSDLCRRRLLNYADSFNELARSYDGKFQPETEDRQAVLSERRLWENRQVLREHLKEMAKIMTEVACEVVCYRPMEERKKRLLIRAMREEGITAAEPCYINRGDGRETVVLTMSTERRAGVSVEEVTDMISVLLNRRLQPAVTGPYVVDQIPHSFVLEQEARFLALTGFSRAIEEGETVSGDNYAVLEAERGRLTVMLSDGTGSGEQAGKDSGQVLDLMEKFLEAGYGTDAAIGMVNTALFVTGGDNNHPTLDVCEIDLYSGRCELRKIGGAATFFKKEERVELLTEGSLPLGIFQQTKAEPICRTMEDGSYLFLVSDGIIDAFGEQEYEHAVSGIIADMKEQNPGEMADRLLRAALIAAQGHIRDDMTVGVIGIWETGIS